jgi:hypothetical protein
MPGKKDPDRSKYTISDDDEDDVIVQKIVDSDIEPSAGLALVKASFEDDDGNVNPIGIILLGNANGDPQCFFAMHGAATVRGIIDLLVRLGSELYGEDFLEDDDGDDRPLDPSKLN